MLHQENELSSMKNSKKDFYIQQLLRIGVYKYKDKQLYELPMGELQEVYLDFYVAPDIRRK
ncbi:ABC-type Mn2+/Zn2+ transport system ATPase subunit [Rossellomorea marisflavi]